VLVLFPQVSDLAKYFPGDARLHGDLYLLRNDSDPEVDFFYNITHVQLHRQQRAMRRLRECMNALPTQAARAQQASNTHTVAAASAGVAGADAAAVSVSSLTDVLLPLLKHFVFENVKAAEKYIQEEATLALAASAAHLPWRDYSSLLRALLKQVGRRPELEAALVKCCCATLDVFPFAPLPTQKLMPEGEEQQRQLLLTTGTAAAEEGDRDSKEDAAGKAVGSGLQVDVEVDFAQKSGGGKKKARVSKTKGQLPGSKAVVADTTSGGAVAAAGDDVGDGGDLRGRIKCKYFTGARNSCSRGDDCLFSHDLNAQPASWIDGPADGSGIADTPQGIQEREWQAAMRGLQFKMLPLMRSHLFHTTTSSKTGAK
jgi:hypothetical protein